MKTNDKDVPATEETAEVVELEKLVRAKDDKFVKDERSDDDVAEAAR